MGSRSSVRLAFTMTMIVAMAGLVISGCTGAKQAAQDDSKASGSAAGGIFNETGLPIVKEPITVKVMVKKNVSDLTTWQEKDAIKKAEQETGIKLDITEVPAMAWQEKMGVVIASGELPDVIIGGIPNLSLYTDSFEPLNGLIDKYAPVLGDLYSKHPELKFAGTFPNGNIYSLPLLQTLGSKVGNSFSINKSWLDKLHLPVPQTIDQFYETLKAFKEKDPNGNGKQDEIPYGFYQNGSFGLDTLLWSFGLVNDNEAYVMVENGKVLFVPSDPRYYEFLKFVHKLYAEGLLDPDGFVQKNADYVAKGQKGLYGFFTHHSYDDIVVGSANSKDYIDFLPMKDSKGNITVLGKDVGGDFFYNSVLVRKGYKYADAIVRLYNYMNSTFDKRMLLSFGPENVVWKKVDGDKWEKVTTIPSGYKNFAELRQTQSPGMSGFFLLTDEDNDKLNITDPRDKKLKQKEELYKPYLKKEVIPMGQDTTEVAQARNNMKTEYDKYISNFVAQSVLKGIDDAGWKAHLDNLKKMNVDKYVKDYQALYDRSLKQK